MNSFLRFVQRWNITIFDKAAGMANDKQKALKHGTHEILIGTEWDIAKQLTISGGYQRTDYGLADDFQSDISFSCDSYSLGFGAAIKMTKHLTMNIAYFGQTMMIIQRR